MKKKLLIIPIIFIVITGCNSNKYKLVWSDEFDYTGKPDSTKWTHEIGGHGWGNNEWQYYTGELKNAEVKEGKLCITAYEENFEDRKFTSARLSTYKTEGLWTYGKIEASIKLPYGQGIWPAFWLLGANFRDVHWPACGEIDIMEMIGGAGRENTTHGTLHWRNLEGRHAQSGGSRILDNGIFADAFHTFSIEWDPVYINWFVDGARIHEVRIDQPEFDAFHKNFYILLNLAVGGNWPGYPDSTTVFPQKLEVDYVRVYQKKAYTNKDS